MSTNIIRLLECDYSTAPDGSMAYIYSQFTNLYELTGSPQALSWQATYPYLNDPATPPCTAALAAKSVMAWKPDTIGLSYPPVSFSVVENCAAGQNGWCRTGTLDFQAFEPIPGKKITSIESVSSGALCNINAAGGTCSWTPPDGDGSIKVWANSSFGDTSPLLAPTWKMDGTPPLLSISAPPADGLNGWYRSPVTLSLTASDATSGLSLAAFSNGATTEVISADGVNSVSATATDNAGNTTTQTMLVKVDQSSPSINYSIAGTQGSAGWYTSLSKMRLDISDAASGISSSFYSVDGGSNIAGGDGVFLPFSDGSHTVSAQAWDEAGNSLMFVTGLQVDTIPPMLNVYTPAPDGQNGWYINPPTFSLSASDATSGLASALFSNGKSTMTFTDDGIMNVYATAKDVAGNSTPYVGNIKKDSTPPSLDIPTAPDGLNGWFVTMPTLSLDARDGLSGLASALFDNGKTTYSVTDQGVSTVTAQAADRAGNTSSTTATVAVDTVPPALYISAPAVDGENGWYVTPSAFSLTASDATSGLSSALFSNGQPTMLINSDGVFNLNGSASDRAGNTSSASRTILVDTTPPDLSLHIPYAPDGQNGWFITRPTLTLAASDETSGLVSAAFEDGSSTYSAQDGTQLVSATARDRAGNFQTISQVFKVDTIPPVLTPSLSGPGANGWYNAEVAISMNTMDTLSGIGQSEYRLDGGDWHSGSGLSVSTEGEHTVEMRVTDNAGNTTSVSRSIKLDTTKPVSSFTNPPEGARIQATGVVTFTGKSADPLSGLAGMAISLDGGATWLPLPNQAGAWTYSWDTTRLPDGLYTILVQADDRAGNRDETSRVQVIVGNKPPKVEIQPAWWLWETGSINIQPRQIPLRDVILRITCAPYHPDVVLKYNGENFPTGLEWDRLCGDGSFAAESGDYTVTLTACDAFGHCAEDSGVIRVPFIAPPVPTWTPTVVPSPTPVSTDQPSSPTEPMRITVVPPTPAPVSTPAQAAPQSLPGWLAWSLAIFLVCQLQLAGAVKLDPRPRALRKLGQTLARLANSEDPYDNQA